ncbi:MAG: TSUP family transporter [Elusimicrobia bacterium]|nr:TSUP family transporter [Elusimicrobiota bacterium]
MACFSPLQWAALSALVFLAGVVDSLAGGGGLITLPAYLAVGLPPSLVLGTNKLSSTIGTAASTANYAAGLGLKLRALLPAAVVAVMGSVLGARLALNLDPGWIRPLLLAALPLAAYSVLSEHRFAEDDRSGEFTPKERLLRSAAVALPVGVYDGFFGPGTGTFLALGFSRLCRFDLLRATAWAKLINLASNAAALAAFLPAGAVHLKVGLAMGLVGAAGNIVGSSLGLKQGAQAIRPVIALVCAGLFIKILLDTKL